MAETVQISLRLPKKLLEAVDAIATDELRTRTNMVEYILTKWIEDNKPEYDTGEKEMYDKLFDDGLPPKGK